MAITLEQCKKYLRIDTDYEDDLLEEFIEASELYLIGAISNYKELYGQNEDFSKIADKLRLVLTAEMFFNRDGRNDSRTDYSYITRSMMNQLMYYSAEEVINLEDGGEPTAADDDR
ncbi:MAG: head-tail connector protein [Selenomonadaceae bacterium]|nr:head-tail connector protein [Selenomonadaceae bacterium]